MARIYSVRPLVTEFTDTFVRANANSLGSNWIRCLGNVGGGTAASGVAFISGNQAVFQGLGNNNPTIIYIPCWVPVPIMNSKVFSGSKQYAQVSWISRTTNIVSGIALRYNISAEAGPVSQQNGQDVYELNFDAAGINPRKSINGGAFANVGAPGVWTLSANDIVRFEAVNNANGSVTLNVYQNGILRHSVTDSTNPILRGFPGFIIETVAVTVASDNHKIGSFKGGLF